MPLDGTVWFTDDEREVLLSVREQISKSGAWCQKRFGNSRFGNDSVQHCLLGWIYTEARHYPGSGRSLCAKLGGSVELIMVNDVLCRSQADVVAFLDRIVTR